jgi:hypothetical protein
MSDKDRLEAEWQGIESALDDLETEHDKGMIDVGRYLKLKTEYETRKAELERELGGVKDTSAVLSTAEQPDTAPRTVAVTPETIISKDGQLVADDEVLHPPSPECDPHLLLKELDVPGGVVRPRSKFYVERQADAQLKAQVVKWGSTTTIRAPRQTGKTSLVVRGILHAREQGINAVFLDFQRLSSDQLISLDVFLRGLAEMICNELGLDEEAVEQAWHGKWSASEKLSRFMEKCVLPAFDEPLVLAMDEADHLLQTGFSNNA